jgi:hypothetical protein
MTSQRPLLAQISIILACPSGPAGGVGYYSDYVRDLWRACRRKTASSSADIVNSSMVLVFALENALCRRSRRYCSLSCRPLPLFLGLL